MVHHPLIIREMADEDCVVISQAFAAQGWDKSVAQYCSYLRESETGKRIVLIGACGRQFAGYVTVVWESDYPPFKEAHIPEIVDFNVLLRYRRQGVGTALMDEAERRIATVASIVGIGVGLTVDYGAAQALYARRGYVPDGCGLFQRGRYLKRGDTIVVDDDLTLYLTKTLKVR